MEQRRLLGVLRPADRSVISAADIPIYASESISLTKESAYDLGAGTQAIMPITWRGTTAVEFSFNFELVAGITVKDRATLFEHMKTAHALSSHSEDGFGNPTGNPVAHLILGQGAGTYINTKGIVKRVETSASGPFDRDLRPTSCRFIGVFIIAPGYGAKLSQIEYNNRTLSAQRISQRFYSFTS